MKFADVQKVVSEFINGNFKSPGKVIEIQKVEDGWLAKLEIIEESEYVRSLGKSDIIGLYEVHISDAGEVMEFKRLLLRERNNINSDK
jgi:hypothetical protein